MNKINIMKKKNMKIKLVIFDMAGTTVKDKNEVTGCFLEAASRTGLNTNKNEVDRLHGIPKKKVFQLLWEERIGKGSNEFETYVNKSFETFKDILENHYLSTDIEPTEGCLELFRSLKTKNIFIGLNTGFYRKVTNIILKNLGWDLGLNDNYVGGSSSIIDVSVTPSEIYNNEGRPSPYMIQKAMYVLGIDDPKSVVVIGDTPSDLKSGVSAGCLKSFAVTNGTHSKEQLEAYKNDGLFSSLNEFSSYLNQFIDV